MYNIGCGCNIIIITDTVFVSQCFSGINEQVQVKTVD